MLEASEKKYRRIFETSMDMIFIADAEGRLQEVNPAGRTLLGLDEVHPVHLPPALADLFADPDAFTALHEELQAHGFVKDLETGLRTGDGRRIEVLFSCSLQRDEHGAAAGYEGIVKDISLRKSIESQLLRADKLASLGQLSAGVAHEINNPLGLILGFAQLLLRDATVPEEQRADLTAIEEEALKCKRIVQALLNFARRTETQRAPVALADLVGEVAAIVRHDFELAGVTLTTGADPAAPEVFGDAEKLRQVIVNLLINARQAVGTGGRVSARTGRRPDPEAVILGVADDGHGILPEHRHRIFDPFFTTKPVGQGTGLGLSVSYGIVQEHGGTIQADDRPGGGTVFTVTLPATPMEETLS